MYATLITEYSLRNILQHSANMLDEMIQTGDVTQHMQNSFTFHLPKASQYLANLQYLLNKSRASFQIIYSEKQPESFIATF